MSPRLPTSGFFCPRNKPLALEVILSSIFILSSVVTLSSVEGGIFFSLGVLFSVYIQSNVS